MSASPPRNAHSERLGADRAPPDGLDRIEKKMASIQHRDWQEVDESEIN